tara:strand:- start:429 stop:845 length:417 start_codon:yes stop_codon:yes gene_type:complete
MQCEAFGLEELSTVAQKVLENLDQDTILCFYGEMGAGKTTLIKAICQQLGVEDQVSSPTYSIVNEYLSSSGEPVYHFDFYRIKSEEEAYDFGYEEYLYSGAICLIEWPERIAGLLPESYAKIEIKVEEGKRVFNLTHV